MYKEIEREELLNYLIEKFKEREEIISVVQVGSGAVGYKDKYSDIDLAIVIKPVEIKEVFKKTLNDISEKFDIVFFDDMEERKLQLFLLNNYLEIDIGYYTLDTLYAKRENYKILYDKSNEVKEIMTKTWNEMKQKNKGTTKEVNMLEVINFIDNELWYNLLHSIISYKRNNLYRCYYEIQLIKDYAIDLIAKRSNKESKRYRQIIELDNKELEKINNLFQYPKTYDELERYLKLCLNIIYEEFEYWNKKENIKYNNILEFYTRFIEINR